MMQFLNNIWIALSTANVGLVNLMLIPATFIENYLLMSLFLIVLNVSANRKQKLFYTISLTILNLISLNLIPSPFNVDLLLGFSK